MRQLCPSCGELSSCCRVRGLVTERCHQQSVTGGASRRTCRVPGPAASAWIVSEDAAALGFLLGSAPAAKLSEGSCKRSRSSQGFAPSAAAKAFLSPAGAGPGSAPAPPPIAVSVQAQAGAGWFGSAGRQELRSLLWANAVGEQGSGGGHHPPARPARAVSNSLPCAALMTRVSLKRCHYLLISLSLCLGISAGAVK